MFLSGKKKKKLEKHIGKVNWVKHKKIDAGLP